MSRTAKASTVSSPSCSAAAEISTSALPPYSPRSVVANRPTLPRWRSVAISTPSSTPVRPTQRSSGWPRTCSSALSWASATKARLASSTCPSASENTSPSGELRR